jgi:hypothetical protein
MSSTIATPLNPGNELISTTPGPHCGKRPCSSDNLNSRAGLAPCQVFT